MGNLREFQLTLLDVMLILDKFLKKNNISYYLIGGSALGAMRHNGFIPWDDDIDIGMGREEFERFETLDFTPLKKQGLLYCPIGKNVIKNAPIGFLYDLREKNADYHTCPTIDIFPIDYVPNSSFLRKAEQLISFVYHLSTSRTAAKNRGKGSYIFTKTILTFTPAFMFKLYGKISKKLILSISKKPTDNVCNIFGMQGYKKEIMPAKYVHPQKDLEFEGHLLPVPGMTHEYLTHLFSDYMTLPPKDMQKPHHKSIDT